MLKGKKSNLSSHDQCETYSFSDMVTNGQFSREKIYKYSMSKELYTLKKYVRALKSLRIFFAKVLEVVGNPVRLCALK